MNTTLDYLNNMRVEWEGTETGLMPSFIKGNPEDILLLKEKAIPDFIKALSDKELFVIAHILLTRISGIEYQAFPKWNGLKVDMASDGTVTIDPEQRHDLAERWKRWYHAEPRPKLLPGND